MKAFVSATGFSSAEALAATSRAPKMNITAECTTCRMTFLPVSMVIPGRQNGEESIIGAAANVVHAAIFNAISHDAGKHGSIERPAVEFAEHHRQIGAL